VVESLRTRRIITFAGLSLVVVTMLVLNTGMGAVTIPPATVVSLLAERLDTRLRHILVDEFQDTSRTQLDLLQQMTREWQDGDGRTVFMVGDPMQSIYGFREADVRGYLRVCEQGLAALRPDLLRLTVNFRSKPGLVHCFNTVFPRVFPAQRDPLLGTVTYTP